MILKAAPVKTSRRAKATATRRKIIDAAHHEFVERGYQGATMAGIAQRAGVASQTVYFVFHTKPELISAVIDTAVMGDEDPRPPESQEWWTRMQEEADAAEALRIFIRGSGDIFARAAAISEILRAAAAGDEEVRRTHDHHENLRRQGFHQVLEMLQEKGSLLAGYTLDELTDVFMTVLGDSTYHLLTSGRGWSHEKTVAWLCAALPALLLDHP